MPAPWLAGVCSGLSVHLGVPVAVVRLGLVALSALFGAGVMLYVWLLATVPRAEQAEAQTPSRRLARRMVQATTERARTDRMLRTRRSQLLVAGIALVALAAVLIGLYRSGGFGLWGIIGVVSLLAGLIVVWSQAPRLGVSRSPQVIGFVVAGIVLIIAGVVLVFAREDSTTGLLRGALLGVVVMIGLLAALLPLGLRLTTDLTASQKEKVRETERADIAAHLHDSVLQTLTLIRASAEDPTRVKALALTQERELRSWLYTGHEAAADSLAEAVREAVGQVESTYGEAVDVVTVGDTVPGPAELAVVAAAAEAVTNAVRHGAPPVSVYVEVLDDTVDVFVKDAGPGFDPDRIPEDRHGVRHSIIGRVERVDGTVRIRALSSGTEVHLTVPRSVGTEGEANAEGAPGADGAQMARTTLGAQDVPEPIDEEQP